MRHVAASQKRPRQLRGLQRWDEARSLRVQVPNLVIGSFGPLGVGLRIPYILYRDSYPGSPQPTFILPGELFEKRSSATAARPEELRPREQNQKLESADMARWKETSNASTIAWASAMVGLGFRV